MHDIRLIAENPAAFDKGMVKRGLPPLAQELLGLDGARREAIATLQRAQERRNAASKEIGQAMAAKDAARAEALKGEVAKLKASMSGWEETERQAQDALQTRLAEIPNLPLDDVPIGKDEHDNVQIRRHGDVPTFAFEAKEHFALGEALGMMDFEAASRMSGARFVVLKGALARLERALGQFMLDLHTGEHGYEEINPPLLVRDSAMFGTAQLPKFAEDQFPSFVLSDHVLNFDKEKQEYNDYFNRVRILTTDYNKSVEIKNNAVIDVKDNVEKFDAKDSFKKNVNIISFWKNKFKNFFTDNFRDCFKDFGAKITDIGKEYEKSNEIGRRYMDYIRAINDSEHKLTIKLMDILREVREIKKNGHWLIPTAEVPLTNLVREQILDEATLPLRVTALTPCFRAEAGAAGRDTRGMIRQHQFNKVELVSITTPEASPDEHARLTACAENVLKKLGLPFRTMLLCSGDMGFASQKTYDIEVWLPGQGRYREISSCSVCGDFQARRMNARCKMADARQTRFVHTLNGSGLAVGRTLVAVMENYQNEDGTITVPEALLPYMGGLKRIG